MSLTARSVLLKYNTALRSDNLKYLVLNNLVYIRLHNLLISIRSDSGSQICPSSVPAYSKNCSFIPPFCIFYNLHYKLSDILCQRISVGYSEQKNPFKITFRHFKWIFMGVICNRNHSFLFSCIFLRNSFGSITLIRECLKSDGFLVTI